MIRFPCVCNWRDSYEYSDLLYLFNSFESVLFWKELESSSEMCKMSYSLPFICGVTLKKIT